MTLHIKVVRSLPGAQEDDKQGGNEIGLEGGLN